MGGLATLLDLFALFVLVRLVGLPAAVANVPALLLGVGAQFVGNKYFAFQDPSRAILKQGAQFALVEAGALFLNAALFHVLVSFTPVPYLAARLVASAVVYFGFSYPLWRRIFRVAPEA